MFISICPTNKRVYKMKQSERYQAGKISKLNHGSWPLLLHRLHGHKLGHDRLSQLVGGSLDCHQRSCSETAIVVLMASKAREAGNDIGAGTDRLTTKILLKAKTQRTSTFSTRNLRIQVRKEDTMKVRDKKNDPRKSHKKQLELLI